MGEARASLGASEDHIITDRGKRNEPFPPALRGGLSGSLSGCKAGSPGP